MSPSVSLVATCTIYMRCEFRLHNSLHCSLLRQEAAARSDSKKWSCEQASCYEYFFFSDDRTITLMNFYLSHNVRNRSSPSFFMRNHRRIIFDGFSTWAGKRRSSNNLWSPNYLHTKLNSAQFQKLILQGRIATSSSTLWSTSLSITAHHF